MELIGFQTRPTNAAGVTYVDFTLKEGEKTFNAFAALKDGKLSRPCPSSNAYTPNQELDNSRAGQAYREDIRNQVCEAISAELK